MANYGLVLNTPQFQPANYSQAYLGGIQAAQNNQQIGIQQQNANNETEKNKAYIPYLEQQTATNKMEMQVKQTQMVNQLTGSVLNADPASRPTAYKIALQQASQFTDTSKLPQEWGEDAETFVKSTYASSGQQLEQLKMQAAQTELAIKQKELQSEPAPLSNAGKVEADYRAGRITKEQADKALAGRGGMSVYDNQGNLIVSTGNQPSQTTQPGLTQNAATDLQKQDNKQITESRKAATDAQNETQSIPALRQAITDYGYTGAGGSTKQFGAKLSSIVGVGTETAATGDFIQSEASKIALFNRKNMPGAMSDADRKFLVDMAAGLDKTPQGNKLILDQAEATRDRLVQKADFKEQYRKTNGNLTGENAAWQRYINDNPIVQTDDKGKLIGIKVPSTSFDNYLQTTKTETPVEGFTSASGKSYTQDDINNFAKQKGLTPEQVVKDYGLKQNQPKVDEKLSAVAPNAKSEIVSQIQPDKLAKLGIDTPERQKQFVAQIAHETAGFTTLTENSSGNKYNGRKDLGNTSPGDGPLYKGRGYIQLTGKKNYEKYGDMIGVDLVNNPDLAAKPEVALQVAAAYWNDKNLNTLADKGNVRAITKRINGGYNGLGDRVRNVKKLDGYNV